MNTTNLIVEYLVSGILCITSICIFSYAVSPNEFIYFLNIFLYYYKDYSTIFLTVAVAISYSLGVAVETIALQFLESILHKKSVIRLKEYINKNERLFNEDVYMKGIFNETITKKTARDCYGNLRFHILSHNEKLYKEIESQINRMRLIRVLFLFELLTLISLIIILIKSFSIVLLLLLSFLVLLSIFTYKSIHTRFDRYFRSIERSYLIEKKMTSTRP